MGNILRLVGDGLRNLVANLGTDRDKASHSYYGQLVLTDDELTNAYRFAWLPRKIVDIVANDACRRWRVWQADKAQVEKLEALESELGVRGKVLLAMKKARLYGGAAIYIGTNVRDVTKPLGDNEKILHLTVITRRNLTADQIDTSPDSETFGLPAFYTVAQTNTRIHASRLIVFHGAELPDPDLSSTQMNHGWGDSVLFAVYDALKNADSTVANVASLVFEAKVDVIKIPDFMSNLEDPEYEKLVLNRIYLAARAKGINGALLIDSNEDYQQKSANFSSLKDVMMAMMQVVSGACDIPMTRLLGQSPGGMQSTGDSDVRNYYDHVSSIQELQMQPAMARFDELLIFNALGSRPDDVWFEWESLWQSTDSEKATVGKAVADTIKTLSDTQLFNADVLSEAAVSVLVESGIMPTLEYVALEEEPEPDDDAVVEGEEEGDDGETKKAVVDGIIRPLYVSRKVLNVKDIRDWAKSQGIQNIEKNLHVTIVHSREPVDWLSCGVAYDQDSNGIMRIPPGGPRDVDKYRKGAIVIEFVSPDLKWRHERILSNSGASTDFPEYKPHITVTYDDAFDYTKVKPYTGPIVLGPEIFEDLQ